MDLDLFKEYFMTFALAVPRLYGCFILLGFLSKKLVGGVMARNGVIFSLALFATPYIWSAREQVGALDTLVVVAIITKEFFIGFGVGYALAAPFWILDGVGSLIDNQRGATIMESMNFMTDEQDSPIGNLLNQAAIAIFFSTGVFLLFMEGAYLSYGFWPVHSFWPKIGPSMLNFATNEFKMICSLIVVLGFPVIIALFLSEMGLAFINRFAPQLNVFVLSLSIKSALALAILIVYVGIIFTYAGDIWSDINTLWQQFLGAP